ncbi:MAG: DEAD/DEAH box helicase, partial [Deltaproteobacteria bacterium]
MTRYFLSTLPLMMEKILSMPDALASLPIFEMLPAVKRSLAEGSNLVLAAEPGSGKTTGVPVALLDEPWLAGKTILMLEPRRLAASMAAARLAWMLDEPVGRTVGYTIRFERRVSPATRIEVVTEGILTRRLQRDPALEGVGLVLFDEFHERSIHADLGLALCLDIQHGLREELRIMVMSATLEVERVAELMGNAGVVIGKGRSFPVHIFYQPPAGRYAAREQSGTGFSSTTLVRRTAALVRKAFAEQQGDILVFLPGSGEIRASEALLHAAPELEQANILPLFGSLPKSVQEAAIRPGADGRRKIVLATPIAETSLTIEG